MSCQGFPRRLRLLTAEDYRHVFDTAAFKLHGKGMMALATPNALGRPRIGLIFSKKNVRRAVDRNRLKRITRESIRHRQHRLPAVDIVLLARRGVQELDNEVVHRQLHGMWRRLEREANKRTHHASAAPTSQR
ncbi:ribonuclease P protein component [Halomonas sp. 18H]|uniref:ribonuclease P protein component n=1 Tax=Halomonas almeriensis TaxID=308163 RepID=UPI00222F171C|nr:MULTISPECIES: ribonuclease P protein component [Halomonas]MCW4152060.1 ribonuclease P protein component [Halomonas sp. 18H]MDN3552497.1 ribonuclease P protein component [Halomonas almeriensis]